MATHGILDYFHSRNFGEEPITKAERRKLSQLQSVLNDALEAQKDVDSILAAANLADEERTRTLFGLDLSVDDGEGNREFALDVGGFDTLYDAVMFASEFRDAELVAAQEAATLEQVPASYTSSHAWPSDLIVGATLYVYNHDEGVTSEYVLY